MKIRITVCIAAALGLVSIGLAQSEAAGAARGSPEQLILQESTALASEERFEEAWQLMTMPASRGGSGTFASPSMLGWRVASVAGALRNRSAHPAADGFARFALGQPWTEAGKSLSRADVAEAGYWCAWLASEILTDRASALVWIEEASRADPESGRIRELKDRLAEQERSFPTR